MPLSNAEKVQPTTDEKMRTEKLRNAQSIKAILAVRSALLTTSPARPSSISSCGLPYYSRPQGHFAALHQGVL